MQYHKILLLGLGFWGDQWMKTLTSTQNCKVAGIAAGQQSIEKIAGKYGVSKDLGYTDYREAIENTDADIVVITLPTTLHMDAAIRSLEKGLNVICEKPLAENSEEAAAIVECRKKYPALKFMVNQNYRWRQHNQTIRRAVLDGMIGAPGSVHIEFRQPECFIGYREFMEMPLLQDVCIHHFDLIRFFTGKNCEKILACTYRPVWSRYGGKPSTEAIMIMEDGIVANYNGTWAARGRETSWDGNITITGDKGCIVLSADNAVRFYAAGDSRGVLLKHAEMDVAELNYALSMFIKCVEKDTLPECDLEDNCQSLSMVCAADESMRQNAFVKVDVTRITASARMTNS